MKEELAEGKLIKAHQRPADGARAQMKECRLFVPCRSCSDLPVPALRSQAHCPARVQGGARPPELNKTYRHTKTKKTQYGKANI